MTQLLPVAALATAAQRTFVASYGSDAHPCSLSQPCRSFGAAIAKTSGDGEVIVLDSAGYGPVKITQSVSIIAPAGIYAGVAVTSTEGITIDGPAIVVTLRGLSINGQGGNFAVHFVQGAQLLIEDCEIVNFQAGIFLEATDSSASIRNTRIRDCYFAGIFTSGTTGGMQISIVESELANNNIGLQVDAGGTVQATVAHSTLSRNSMALRVAVQTGGNGSILSDGNTIIYSTVVFTLVGPGVGAIFTPGNNTVGYYGTLVQGGVLSPCCGV